MATADPGIVLLVRVLPLLLALLAPAGAVLAPSTALAETTVVDSPDQLAWLKKQKRIDGSVVVRLAGLQTLELPKLKEVTERFELDTPDLVALDLPRLERVGSDLSVGCHHHSRERWQEEGPLRPLRVEDLPTDGFDGAAPRIDQPAADAAPVSLARLEGVGGQLAVCAPGVLGLDAPALTSVGTDLQLFASAAWRDVSLPALERVRGGHFLWLVEADLTVDLPALERVNGTVQGGGAGTLRWRLPVLEQTAAFTLTGTRQTAAGTSETPSLTLAELVIPRLQRASGLFSVQTVTGLSELAPPLADVQALQVTDVPGLRRLALPDVASVRQLAIQGLPDLQELDLAGLRRVEGSAWIGTLGLDTLSLDVEEVADLTIEQTARTIELPKLRRVTRLRLIGLGPVERVSLPALEQVTGMLMVGESLPLDGSERDLPDVVRVFEAPALTVVGETVDDRLQISAAAFSVVRLPALERVAGGLYLVDLPRLARLEVPRLRQVLGRVAVTGSRALEVLELPSLEKTEVLELVALPALKRVSARRLQTRVLQKSGTTVGVIELAR